MVVYKDTRIIEEWAMKADSQDWYGHGGKDKFKTQGKMNGLYGC